MENVIDASSNVLGDLLSYRVPSTSSSVLERKSVQFHPSGNQFGPAGVKSCKIPVNGDSGGYLIPSTLTLRVECLDLSGATQTLSMSLWGAVRTLTVTACGQQLERIDSYNRVYEMIRTVFSPSYTQDEAHTQSGKPTAEIAANASATLSMPIYCGLQGCGRAISLKHCPLVFDFQPVDSASDWLSGALEWRNVVICADCIYPDPAIDDAITKKLLSGGNLNLPISTWFVTPQQVASADMSIATSRSVSRLKKIILNPTGSSDQEGKISRYPGANFKVGVRIGPNRFPNHDVEDDATAFMHLAKCLSHQNDGLLSMNCSPAEFKSTKWNLGLGFEKQDGIYATGQSLKQGELTVTSFKNLDTSTCNRCFVMCEHDVILSLSDQGAASVCD